MKKVFIFLGVLVAGLSHSNSVHSADRYDYLADALARPIVSYDEAELMQELEYLTNPQKQVEDMELDELLVNLTEEATEELDPYIELELMAARAEKESKEMIDKMMSSFIFVDRDGIELNYTNNNRSFYKNIMGGICYYFNWK